MQPWQQQIKVALTLHQPAALEQLARESQWVNLPATEREQLASELSQEAVRCMESEGDQHARRLLDLALTIAPVSSKVFLMQGAAFYQKAWETQQQAWVDRALERLNKAVQYAAHIGMEHIWLIKAQLLAFDLTQKHSLLQQAKELWLSLPLQINDAAYETQRHLMGGKLWYAVAKYSEEPSDYQQAVILLKMALECQPGNLYVRADLGYCLMALAKTLMHRGCLHEAIGHFEAILEESKVEHGLLISLAQGLYDIYLQTGIRHLARKSKYAFERAFKMQAVSLKDVDAYASITLLLAEVEFTPGLLKPLLIWLKPFLSKHLRLRLMHWHARFLVAQAAERLDNLHMLEKELIEAQYEMEGEAHYWMLRGLCASFRATYFRDVTLVSDVIDFLQRGLTIDHDRPGLWLHLARAYLLQAELAGDIEPARKATQIFPMAIVCGKFSEQFWIDWGLSFFQVADALGDRSLLSEALLRFEKALEMISGDGLDTNYKLLYYYGSALDFLGDLQRDEEYYERAVHILQLVAEAQPNNEDALCAYAVALTHWGESTAHVPSLLKAHELFQHLIRGDHEDEYIWNEWGVCLLSLARIQKEEPELLVDYGDVASQPWGVESINRLQRSRRLGNPHALYNLCCAYTVTGDIDRALDYLDRALESGTYPPLQDMLEDDWLEPLRSVIDLRSLLQKYAKLTGEELARELDFEDDAAN